MGCRCKERDDWDDDARECGDDCDCGEDCGCEPDYGDDEDATVPCPYCGQEMYDDSPRCPHCDRYISKEDMPPARQPMWVVVGIVLCLCAAAVWIFVY
jgi:hypothetical protein